jgi:hypothetical protein
VALFDIGDDLVAGPHSPSASFGRHDELGTPVGRVVGPVYVAKALQLVDYRGDRLLVPPRYPGQIRQPDAVFVEVGQHRAVTRSQVVKALFRGAVQELDVGAPVEDTISVMQLITRGIPSRYPDIKIINSHLGGALPMLLQRADNQYLWESPDTPELPSTAARRMWYDTVGHGHVPALRCAVDSFGADRLLLGTDFPYEAGDIFVRRRLHLRLGHTGRPGGGHPRAERDGTTGNRTRPEPVTGSSPMDGQGPLRTRPSRLCSPIAGDTTLADRDPTGRPARQAGLVAARPGRDRLQLWVHE